MKTALERARGVARLGPNKFEGKGTGFLFDPAWAGGRFAGHAHLLLTNAHVCTADPAVRACFPFPAAPEETRAVFLGSEEKEPQEITVLRQVWTSPPAEYDATLLEIDAPPAGAVPPPDLATSLPTTEGEDSRVNVIGHPRGFTVRVSLQDNRVVAVQDKYVHCRAPTDPGSSGSPVFNQEWKLVALHHASAAGGQANEGVRMDRLLAAMRA